MSVGSKIRVSNTISLESPTSSAVSTEYMNYHALCRDTKNTPHIWGVFISRNGLERLSAFESAAKSNLVGVLEVNTDGQTTCQACNADWAVANLLLNVECC